MLESPLCLSFLNLARVLNVGERRRGEWQMFGGTLGARDEQSSKDGLRGGMQVVGCIQLDQCSPILKTAAQSCTTVAAEERRSSELLQK